MVTVCADVGNGIKAARFNESGGNGTLRRHRMMGGTRWREGGQRCDPATALVFESPVRSGYLALPALTETETG
jgi:hypothetical protein